MPPGKPSPGEEQEERVRSQLVAEGYEQPFGASDGEIRRNLGITGKCADFVGYHPQLDGWLVAESKGGDLEKAEAQLKNTLSGLLAKISDAVMITDLRVYIRAEQYDKLSNHLPASLSLGGYYLRSNDSYLGNYDESNEWVYRELTGIRILAVRVSKQ